MGRFIADKTRVYNWYISLVAASCMVLYGYDASVYNSVQGSKNWVAYFNHPDTEKIGAVNTAYTVGRYHCWILSWRLDVFIAGRVIIGLGQGVALTAGPVYIGELAPPEIRGKIMAFWQMFYSVGSFIAYWINYACQKHVKKLGEWVEAARTSLRRVRKTEQEVEDEILVIREALEFEKEAISASYSALWKDRSVRKRLILAFILNIGQQLTGQGTLNTYSTAIYKKSHPVGIAIVFLLFLFILFYKPSWGATVWIWTAEVFSMNVRAQAVGMSSQMQNVANSIFQQFFPTFLKNEGFKTFYFFFSINIFLALYVWFFIPETKKVNARGNRRALRWLKSCGEGEAISCTCRMCIMRGWGRGA
ncbi:hypothetical protein EYC84_010030 [Monilinia fructicola]|uniref:Major facilitator superfamily (MFS) profile domain-containing protein n=1 Tax=Monilinia fructicola TaxID=38448 RepID=A0A5M9JC59_MONFR|nr:hypothetical protein EYC84_010030 [Monilinia fructicola]